MKKVLGVRCLLALLTDAFGQGLPMVTEEARKVAGELVAAAQKLFLYAGQVP